MNYSYTVALLGWLQEIKPKKSLVVIVASVHLCTKTGLWMTLNEGQNPMLLKTFAKSCDLYIPLVDNFLINKTFKN